MPRHAPTAATPRPPEAEPSTGAPPPLPEELAITLRGFLGYLRVECGLSPATLEAYGRDARLLLEDAAAAAATGPRGLTGVIVTRHIVSLSRDRGLAGATIARHLSTIRVLTRWLLARGLIDHDPTATLDPPTRWKRIPGVLGPADMRRLVETPGPDPARPAAPGSPELWVRDRAILELMYACGLRASEVGLLSLDAIIEETSTLRVLGKGDKHRLVPMGGPAVAALDRYLTRCRPGLVEIAIRAGDPTRHAGRVFLTRTGRPIERVRIWQMVRSWAERAGLGRVHPHMLRHSFATHLLAGGADLRVVQELLGHADIATTQIYTHVDRSGLKALHRKLHPRG